MLAAVNVQKKYGGISVLHDLCIEIERGNTVGLTGESGSGKSTLTRLLCCLERCSRGTVELDGSICNAPFMQGRDHLPLKEFRKKVQIVFQDSNGSLDPRMTVLRLLAEPLNNFSPRFRRASRREKYCRAGELLERVGLDGEKSCRYPHELSGGQRQRVVIARALAAAPEYLLCDEPVSSLDTESREGILELLASLQRQTNMGCLFISHDPVLVQRISRRIHVMQEGHITATLHRDAGGT